MGAPISVQDLVAEGGYGRGLPVYPTWGTDILRAYRDAFLAAVSSELGRVTTWQPSLFRHDRQPEPSWDFASTLTVDVPVYGAFALRPDAAVDGLRTALTPLAGGVAVAVYQAFRALHGACSPMLRDQAISPVIQMSVVRDVQAAVRVETALDTFFGKLCLPVRKVDMGVWKQYAAGRVDWVLSTAGRPPTVLAMAYSVGSDIRRLAGVPQDAAAFDVGLTAKPLALVDALAGVQKRTVLPSCVAPVNVVVGSVDGTSHDLFPVSTEYGAPRVRHVSATSRNWWKPWFRRGVPVLLECRQRRLRRLVGHHHWQRHDLDVTLADLLIDSDASIRALSPVGDWPEQLGASWRSLCERCSATAAHRLDAAVRPHIVRPCESCTREGLLRLIAPTEQIY